MPKPFMNQIGHAELFHLRCLKLSNTFGCYLSAPSNNHRGWMMTFRLSTTVMLVAVLGLGPATPVLVTSAMAEESDISAFDPDKDGTIDLMEAQRAATATFDKLDQNKDQDLDAKELSSRLSEAELKEANPDKDGLLGRNEYLKLVGDRFKAADPDNDGTIDAKELESPAGKALLQLMR